MKALTDAETRQRVAQAVYAAYSSDEAFMAALLLIFGLAWMLILSLSFNGHLLLSLPDLPM